MFRDGTLESHYTFEFEFPKEKNVVDVFLNEASRHCKEGLGDAEWITEVESGESITFSEIEPLSRKVASSLFKRGMRRGDILLYSSHHPTKLHVFFLGVWRANGVVRAIYPQENKDVIAEKIVESNARFYLCDPETVPEVTAAIKNVPWPVEVIVFGQAENCTSADQVFEDPGDACPALDAHENDMAVIFSTSGTTGPSKGAVHTHSSFIKTIVNYQKCMMHDDVQPFLCMGKQTHISGFAFSFVSLVTGRRTIIMKNLTTENTLYAVHHYKPSLVLGFPKFLLCLVNDESANKYDLSSIRHVAVGGVVITPSFISTMESLPGVRVTACYGMTECAIFASTKNYVPSSSDQLKNPVLPNVPNFSPGKLPPGVSLQVRDLETGELLGPNKRGELYFKSSSMCAGYYKRPKESEEAGFGGGWVKTGDVGYFDENGFLLVVDRCKEIFKYYNNHISPSEIENVINLHDAVDNVCVVGVPDPDGGDTIPRAFVTLKDPIAVADDILKFANENLPSYKQLRGGLFVLKDLPLGKSGKVSRDILSRMPVSV